MSIRRTLFVSLIAGTMATAMTGCTEIAALATTPVSGTSERGTFVGVLSGATAEPRPTPPERPAPQAALQTEPARQVRAIGTTTLRSPTAVSLATTPSQARSTTATRSARVGSPVPTPTFGLGAVALPTLPPIPTVSRLFAGPTPPAGRPSPLGSSAAPIDRLTCPPTHPVKGVVNVIDRRSYLPIHVDYRSQAPVQCFASEALAAANGYARSPR